MIHLPLLSDIEGEMLITVFHHLRKKTRPHYTRDHANQDLHDALQCLKLMGYIVIPKGILDSLRKSLSKIEE